MIFSIVAALAIFFWGLPLLFHLFLWVAMELVEHPLRTVTAVLVVACLIYAVVG